MRKVSLLVAAALLAACTASDTPGEALPATSDPTLDLSERLDALARQSCPEGISYVRAEAINISAEPVSLGDAPDVAEALNGVTFAGGWHLQSENPKFGGLSGMDVLPSGGLLTVSDQGAFVWIGLENGAPDGIGGLADMRGADGAVFSDKRNGDAEGLAVDAGRAIVSFERNHRALVYDLEACGSSARGAVLASIPRRIADAGPRLEDNGGLEGLAISSDQLIGTIEAEKSGTVSLIRLDASAPDLIGTLEAPDGLAPTGLDTLDDAVFAVFRDYAPGVGNTIEVRRYTDAQTNGETLLRLARPLAVDNFEAVAVREWSDGRTRLYLLSDDNFSERQRTLLFAFDINNSAPTD